jgi:hypothetical protein
LNHSHHDERVSRTRIDRPGMLLGIVAHKQAARPRT